MVCNFSPSLAVSRPDCLPSWALCCNFPKRSLLSINLTICFSSPAPKWLDAVGRGKACDGAGVVSNLSYTLHAALWSSYGVPVVSSFVPHNSSYTTPSTPHIYPAKVACFLLSQRTLKPLHMNSRHLSPPTAVGSLISLMSQRVFVCVLSKSVPETKILVGVIYLGGGPRAYQ